MIVFLFILACYGLTMILVYGKIFDHIRPQYHLFHCTLCMGTWVGFFNWFMFDLPFNILVAGFISAGTSYMLSKIIDDDGIAIKNK